MGGRLGAVRAVLAIKVSLKGVPMTLIEYVVQMRPAPGMSSPATPTLLGCNGPRPFSFFRGDSDFSNRRGKP